MLLKASTQYAMQGFCISRVPNGVKDDNRESCILPRCQLPFIGCHGRLRLLKQELAPGCGGVHAMYAYQHILAIAGKARI